ncbi:hypothetical protein CYMTET_38789 [Cymbomonas tetramitiformis]|uniref:Uncharacterized protein n=1 Tax=Cymbomonas tetramitiformis TaxID=36881 RepID=A0AAE0CDK0_9CHLO|nr:hypothetical protein CYMTET_38789 [Cymbomonas tetramitiformis]
MFSPMTPRAVKNTFLVVNLHFAYLAIAEELCYRVRWHSSDDVVEESLLTPVRSYPASHPIVRYDTCRNASAGDAIPHTELWLSGFDEDNYYALEEETCSKRGCADISEADCASIAASEGLNMTAPADGSGVPAGCVLQSDNAAYIAVYYSPPNNSTSLHSSEYRCTCYCTRCHNVSGAEAFYAYGWPNASSANTGYEKEGAALLYFVGTEPEQADDASDVYFVLVNDKATTNAGQQGGKAQISLEVLPVNVTSALTFLVRDDQGSLDTSAYDTCANETLDDKDPNDDCYAFDKTTGKGSFGWVWPAGYTDGMVLGPLPATDFCFYINMLDSSGLTSVNLGSYNNVTRDIDVQEVDILHAYGERYSRKEGLQVCAFTCDDFCSEYSSCSACASAPSGACGWCTSADNGAGSCQKASSDVFCTTGSWVAECDTRTPAPSSRSRDADNGHGNHLSEEDSDTLPAWASMGGLLLGAVLCALLVGYVVQVHYQRRNDLEMAESEMTRFNDQVIREEEEARNFLHKNALSRNSSTEHPATFSTLPPLSLKRSHTADYDNPLHAHAKATGTAKRLDSMQPVALSKDDFMARFAERAVSDDTKAPCISVASRNHPSMDLGLMSKFSFFAESDDTSKRASVYSMMNPLARKGTEAEGNDAALLSDWAKEAMNEMTKAELMQQVTTALDHDLANLQLMLENLPAYKQVEVIAKMKNVKDNMAQLAVLQNSMQAEPAYTEGQTEGAEVVIDEDVEAFEKQRICSLASEMFAILLDAQELAESLTKSRNSKRSSLTPVTAPEMNEVDALMLQVGQIRSQLRHVEVQNRSRTMGGSHDRKDSLSDLRDVRAALSLFRPAASLPPARPATRGWLAVAQIREALVTAFSSVESASRVFGELRLGRRVRGSGPVRVRGETREAQAVGKALCEATSTVACELTLDERTPRLGRGGDRSEVQGGGASREQAVQCGKPGGVACGVRSGKQRVLLERVMGAVAGALERVMGEAAGAPGEGDTSSGCPGEGDTRQREAPGEGDGRRQRVLLERVMAAGSGQRVLLEKVMGSGSAFAGQLHLWAPWAAVRLG